MPYTTPAQLPLASEPHPLDLDQRHQQRFQQAFQASHEHFPPSLFALGLEGVFEILENLKIPLSQVLHLSQSFEFLEEIQLPFSGISQAHLVRWRERKGAHWLSFDVKIHREEKLKVQAESLMLFQEKES